MTTLIDYWRIIKSDMLLVEAVYVRVLHRKRPGPLPAPPRAGDKRQARRKVNLEVRSGRWPLASSVPCVDCGHVWTNSSKRRHEYDHCSGYGTNGHLIAEVICQACHLIREGIRMKEVD